ncbi:MAG: hypothetical protein WCJ30_15295 [Deltaproteobacteria bacterium]
MTRPPRPFRPRPGPATSVWLVVLAVAGCASARPGPADVIASYTAALREQRFSDAYRLLSAEARRALPYDDYEQLARGNPDELRETVRWLDQVDPTTPATARMELPSGDALLLVLENGQWRLDPSALDFYGQHTPRQALRSFARALERRRYDVLLRFVPRRLAAGMTAEALRRAWEGDEQAEQVQLMLRALRAGLDHPIEIVGDRATLQYGLNGRFVAQLVREDGAWKIEDPD